MEIKKYFKKLSFLLIFIMMFLLIAPAYNTKAAEQVHRFDTINVLDDLESSDNFKLINYPFDLSGVNKTPGIINIVEWCYSPFKPEDFALYIYFYNPQNKDIDKTSLNNRIQIATQYTDTVITADSIPTDYETFQLIYCNRSERADYEGLFYKFRVIDHKSKDGKTIQTRVNSLERRYDISGITLAETDGTIKEYAVGGSYRFTGYAAGYGPNEFTDSTLKNTGYVALETISIKVNPTVFRTSSSDQGAYHQNQLNSVYFSVPEKYFTNYGDLQKIKAEWWEYKTAPILILRNISEYNEVYAQIGKSIGNHTELITNSYYNESVDYSSYIQYDIGYNVKLGLADKIKQPIDTLYYVFHNPDLTQDTLIKGSELESYIYNYKKTYNTGKITTGSGTISNDLFVSDVDTGRQRGYNQHEFDANDKFNLLSYSESHNNFDKFLDFGFWAPKTNDTYSNISPIDANISSDIINLSESVISDTLLIAQSDVSDFKNFYNTACENNERPVLFRFAQTDYFNTPMYSSDMDAFADVSVKGKDACLAQETVFFDFKIIHLTFQTKDTYKVIPVTQDPINLVGSIESPAGENISDEFNKFLEKIGAWGVLIISVIVSGVALFLGLNIIKGIASGNVFTKILMIGLLVLLCVGMYFGISWVISTIANLGGL